MRGRGNIRRQEVADAINVIPVLFRRNARIRRAYDLFCAIPNGDPITVAERYSEILVEVARELGFREFDRTEVALGYFPNPLERDE